MKNPTILDEIRALAPGRKDLRSFAWVVGGAFVVLWAVLAYLLPALIDKGGSHPALAAIGVALALVGTVAPKILKPLYYGWMSLALTLGFVMTRVLLTIFFFLVLTPVGLVMKLLGRDPLERKLDPEGASYWIDKEYLISDRSRYEKFF